MSGFFSLGGKDQLQPPETDINNNNSFILFKSPEIYNKGFELWQQYYHLHHHRLLHHNVHDFDFSVAPAKKIDTDHCVGDDSDGFSYRSGSRTMRQGRGGNEGVNCQDCGNQAKKDCAFFRCRTCCQNRGFDCQTHVKSTWVPAAKRRQRLEQLSAVEGDAKRMRESPHGGGGGGSAVACTSLRLPSTTSGFVMTQLPAEVSSPAVFRCVRVSAMDDAEEHYAYQTAVSIGGHVFKGILYDQGSESRYRGGESSSGCQQLDLIAASSSTAAATTCNPSIAMLEPSNYPTPLTAFMAGTQFFPPPRP